MPWTCRTSRPWLNRLSRSGGGDGKPEGLCMPRVTVIMATYNWATVLPYSIASALDQTFTDFELLVVGDGCTDESSDVVSAVDDPRVRWHNLPSTIGFQAGPNNEGIRQASGELIAYLGHDDVWLPTHLELLVDSIDRGARFAHAGSLIVRPDQHPSAWPPRKWQYQAGEGIPPT